MRMYISAHKHGHTWVEHEEYTEAIWWYVNYAHILEDICFSLKAFQIVPIIDIILITIDIRRFAKRWRERTLKYERNH